MAGWAVETLEFDACVGSAMLAGQSSSLVYRPDPTGRHGWSKPGRSYRRGVRRSGLGMLGCTFGEGGPDAIAQLLARALALTSRPVGAKLCHHVGLGKARSGTHLSCRHQAQAWPSA